MVKKVKKQIAKEIKEELVDPAIESGKEIFSEFKEEGGKVLKGILESSEDLVSEKEQQALKKEAKKVAAEEEKKRKKKGEKKETVAQQAAKVSSTKKVPEKKKIKDPETGKTKTVETGRMVDAPAVAFGASNIKPKLGRQEAIKVLSQLDRSGSIVPDRVLYGMGYLTDQTILKNAQDGAKALNKYFQDAERKFLNELGSNPSVRQKYEAMAANNFENVFEKLAREKTPTVDPEEFYGDVIVGTMSDLSGTYGVSMINGIPVTLRHTGGTGFMSLIENMAQDVGWAAALKTMRTFSGRVDRVMNDTNRMARVMPLDMSPEAISYTSAMAQALMQQIKNMPGAIQPSVKRAFDKRLRMDYPQWVGLDHPLAEQQIAGIPIEGVEEMGPGARKKFQYMIASAGMQKLGFPDWLATARVLSKPGFMEKPLGYGQKFIMPKEGGPDVNVKPMVELGLNNQTYDAGYLVEGFGKLIDSVPPEILFRDAWKQLGKEKTKGEKPRALTYPEKVKALQIRKDLYQEVDEEWVESVTNYLQKAAASKTEIILPGGQAGKIDPGMLLGMFGISMMGLAAAPEAEGAPFIGLFAKSFKKNILDVALEMEEAGASREEIWSATAELGQPMFRHKKDKMWRSEISAKDAKVDLDKLPKHKSSTQNLIDYALKYAEDAGFIYGKGFQRGGKPITKEDTRQQFDNLNDSEKAEAWQNAKWMQKEEVEKEPYALLPDILDFPELFENYPILQNLQVKDIKDRYLLGQFDQYKGETGRVNLNVQAHGEKGLRKTLMHEINHAIEFLEGFGRGGSSSQFIKKEDKKWPTTFLKQAKSLAKKLQKKGYKQSDIKKRIQVYNGTTENQGFQMWNGEFVSLADLGIQQKLFMDMFDFGFAPSKIFDDPDIIEAMIEYNKTQSTRGKGVKESPADLYRKLVGETQARKVEARIDFDEEKIADVFPGSERESKLLLSPAFQEEAKLKKEIEDIVQFEDIDFENVSSIMEKYGLDGDDLGHTPKSFILEKMQEARDAGATPEEVKVFSDAYNDSVNKLADRSDDWRIRELVIPDDKPSLEQSNTGFVGESASESRPAGKLEETEIFKVPLEKNETSIPLSQAEIGLFDDVFSNPADREEIKTVAPNVTMRVKWGEGDEATKAELIGPEEELAMLPDFYRNELTANFEKKLGKRITNQEGSATIPALSATAATTGGAATLGQQVVQNSEQKKEEQSPKTELQAAAQNAAKAIIEEKAQASIEDPQRAAQDDSLFNQAINAEYSMLDHIERETGLPLRMVADTAKEFFTGDQRRMKLPENVRNLEESDPFGGQVYTGDAMSDLKIAYGLLLGDTDDKVAVIQGNDPGATFDYYDEEGNLLAPDAPKTGNEAIHVKASRGEYILNQPGMTKADGSDIVGELINYAPATKAFTVANRGYGRAMPKLGTLGQSAMFGGGEAATSLGVDALMQGLGSEKPIDPAEAAIFGGMAAMFPPAGAAFRKAGEYVDPIKEALDPIRKFLDTEVTSPSRSMGPGGIK